ncbi:MAG TPA: magnesium-translocating P-type ATPase, partial [Gemmatimonadales bacterium]|nr:magnesium-translocating P-type ATPase [Gemmatimonadales bacterium]
SLPALNDLMAPAPASRASSAPPFWSQSLEELQAQLGAPPAGLDEEEAARRLLTVGANRLVVHQRQELLRLVLDRFKSPLLLLLLAASLISALTGDRASAVVITVIIGLSVTLDAVQEHRAGRAAERLRDSVAITARVIRDGVERTIPAHELVPGDLVVLAAGDLVPADGRLVDARDCFVNEAALTGEAYPVEKAPGPGQPAGSPQESRAALLLGCSLVSGSARMLVVRTGRRTALGEIGHGLGVAPPPTAFETGTRRFGLFILRLAIGLILFVVVVNLFRGRPVLESFLFAVALAVGLTPELLPMIASVTLARGALRLAARKVIVKRLAAIHDLGSMDVLCTDKTGTLTEARIRLERHLDPEGRDSDRVLELAYLNSYFGTGLRSPMDEAILRHTEVSIAGWSKIDETPFDFERRRAAILVAGGGRRLLVVKGALEDGLRCSTQYEAEGPDRLRPLDEEARTRIRLRFDALSHEGFRVLAVAWKAMPADCPGAAVGDERDLVFAGFAAFEDPPRATARTTLADLAASGITVKVVTGDNELVTQHLCEEVGLAVSGVLTGAEIEPLADDALDRRVEQANLFCRVTPAQKQRVILALRRRGHVVGYLGDGINDAPPLHSADLGISVSAAVDVAKAAADLILMEPDLGVLHHAVLEGRRTIANILKYVMMAASSNFGNMFSMAAAAVVLPFLPLLPAQVLLNNFLYDLSEVAIPMDGVDAIDLARPRRWDIGFIRSFMIVAGPISSVFDFLTFYVMLHYFRAGEALFHTGWFVESLATQVLVIFVIRTRGNPLRSRPSALLALTSLCVVAVAGVLPLTALGARLGFVPPPPGFFPVLAALVAAYLVTVELAKRWFFRRMTRPLPFTA